MCAWQCEQLIATKEEVKYGCSNVSNKMFTARYIQVSAVFLCLSLAVGELSKSCLSLHLWFIFYGRPYLKFTLGHMWFSGFLSEAVISESGVCQSGVQGVTWVALIPRRGLCEVKIIFLMIVRGHLLFLCVDLAPIVQG